MFFLQYSPSATSPSSFCLLPTALVPLHLLCNIISLHLPSAAFREGCWGINDVGRMWEGRGKDVGGMWEGCWGTIDAARMWEEKHDAVGMRERKMMWIFLLSFYNSVEGIIKWRTKNFTSISAIARVRQRVCII